MEALQTPDLCLNKQTAQVSFSLTFQHNKAVSSRLSQTNFKKFALFQ